MFEYFPAFITAHTHMSETLPAESYTFLLSRARGQKCPSREGSSFVVVEIKIA
jgi:hypothetical protein